MLIQTDNFLISVTDTVERPMLYGEGGVPLIIDTDFNPKEHRKQTGRICGLPIKVSKQYTYNNDLQIGDQVLFNHLALEDERKFKPHIYRVELFLIFAKINNGIVEPIDEFIICEASVQEQSTVIKGADKISSKYCKALALSENAKKSGVKANDLIYFTHNADYSFKVGSKEFIRLRTRNVVAVERDGELIPMREMVMVEQVIKEEKVAGLTVVKQTTNQRIGKVLKIAEGNEFLQPNDEICFYYGSSVKVNWKGKEYCFVDINNIKFVYDEES